MGGGDQNGRAWPEAARRVCQCSSHHMDESVKEINMIVLVLYYIGNFIGILCEANGLVYSRCPTNTNDLATPLTMLEPKWDLVNILHVYLRGIFHYTSLHLN